MRGKRIARGFLATLLVLSLFVSILSAKTYAWKNLTHVNSADLILLELERSANQNGGNAKVSIRVPYGDGSVYSYSIPKEFQEALTKYPDAFRAGSMGPDFYPDILTGQGFIHPYDYEKGVGSGEWITLLVDSVNRLPKDSEDRKEALAFTLGFMLHYCGDMFGHDFINSFSGGTYPALTDVDYLDGTDANLNIILGHMSEESYMDSLVNWSFYNSCDYLNIAAPIDFVIDTLVYNGDVNNGPADVFRKYGKVPTQYEYLLNLRMELYNLAEEWRPSVAPWYTTAVKYLDAWVEDLDVASYELVKCFDRMANQMVTQEDPSTLGIVKNELQNWVDNYGKYITPTPDIVIDGIKLPVDIGEEIMKAIGLAEFVQDLEDWMMDQIEDLALSALGFVGLKDQIDAFKDRMSDPSVQLDDPENPFKPSSNNFAEFKEYMDRYAAEQNAFKNKSHSSVINGSDGGALDNALDSDLEAFYNTLTMFKLILMGPDNFQSFIKDFSGVTVDAYHKNEVTLVATSLEVEVWTKSVSGGGTDDNIFIDVYKTNGEHVIKKLLDISGYDDFEQGDHDFYTVELGQPVRIDELEVYVVKERVLGDDWTCAGITITPMHAGAKLNEGIGFGGREMTGNQTWNLGFHDELMQRISPTSAWKVTDATVRIKTRKNESIFDTYGTDSNVYLDVYDGSTRVQAILLDKPWYNDFESNDDDTYNVSINNVPVNNINLKLRLAGGDEWCVYGVWVTLHHADFSLTNTIYIDGYKTLDDSTWNLDIHNQVMNNLLSYTPISISYVTNLDDGAICFVDSLDDSRQWENSDNLLWGNKTIRSNVFFKIFKGYGPQAKMENTIEVLEEEAFDLNVNLEGMWNGIPEARRNAIKAIPAVNGSVTVSFINSDNGNVACSFDRTVTNGKISVSDYSNENLLPGIYDIRVSYYADTSNPMYSNSVTTIEKALKIIEKPTFTYTIRFQVVNGSWDDGTTGEKVMEIKAKTITQRLSSTSFPAVGNVPNLGYKAGEWNIPLGDTTKNFTITADTMFVYTFEKRNPISQDVTFKIVNGSWEDGTTGDINLTLRGFEGDDLKLDAAQIPVVGLNPVDNTYKAGAWDVTPSVDTVITGKTTYTYTYAKKPEITQTVTFKVENGTWDDGKTDEITVELKGLEGDVLKLKAAQIPEVGSKPGTEYKAGAWDVTPVAGTEITGNPTYTYTYVNREEISHIVKFRVANGSWNDGSTGDQEIELNGFEGDVLTFTASQIPAVGSKPDTDYKEGFWDVTPKAGVAIGKDTTYTYNYIEGTKTTISKKVTFKVVNGFWADGSTADKELTLGGTSGETIKLIDAQIPAIGKPGTGYKTGSWDEEPVADTTIDADKTYTYTFVANTKIERTVTFKVVNGAWDDDKKDDVTVKLSGYDGDVLALKAIQIPEVGSKPNDKYEAGSWNKVPVAGAEITDDVTYTYTYAEKPTIKHTVTFKVVNGFWDGGKNDDVEVELSGYVGDKLVLDGAKIPVAGNEPKGNFEAGYWDEIPVAGTVITGNKTFTYNYVQIGSVTTRTVTFKVVNGSWDDGTKGDVVINLSDLNGGKLELTASQIPAVGSKPDAQYKAGSWDVAPAAGVTISDDLTYTYTYAEKAANVQTVTFRVENGSWNDGSKDELVVQLSGADGVDLMLADDQIPLVGGKPDSTYKAGGWDFVPDTTTAITGNPTFTYTYIKFDMITKKVTFHVENGTWDDGTTKDKVVMILGPEGTELKLDATQIPAVGTRPNDTYKTGAWEASLQAGMTISSDTTFVYTYAPKEPVTYTVKFKVQNGAFNDGSSNEKSVTLNGLEGDVLYLSKGQIPEVGLRPDDIYKAGKWDVLPTVSMGISGDVTFTYTYALKAKCVVTFEVFGGSKVDPITVYEGEFIESPGRPYQHAYNFIGWYADKECTTPYDFNAGVFEDTVIYAYWKKIVYLADPVEHNKGENTIVHVKRNYYDMECFSHFKGVLLDGRTLSRGADYTAEPGSTIVTLKDAALQGLSAGEHVVTVQFDDGEVIVTLIQNAVVTSPRTGEDNPEIWIAMILVCAAIAFYLLSSRKKYDFEK